MTVKTERLLYQDAGQPIESRVEDLLNRMTLKEKVGQLNMVYPLPEPWVSFLGREIPSTMEACKRFAEGTYSEEIGPGAGFFAVTDFLLQEGPRQQASFLNECQTIALEKTRLQIPLLVIEEGPLGVMMSGATVFPEGLAIGSAWNTDLARDIYAAAAKEARAVGVHQLCTLVVEPNRDPRLGRNCEGYSEDPYLCARIAESIVEGAQGHDISSPEKAVATLSHFPGQSQPVSGLEYGAMEISERTLREVFLPPWVAGIKKAGALGVMVTYPAIDGIPAHASEKLLTGILREELGFRGIALSEGDGLATLIWQRVAATQKEAGAMALRAGVDIDISYEDGFLKPLIENVEEGKVPIELVDRAVRRVLELKFRLGLFGNPFVDLDRAIQVVHAPEHQELALQAAREGIVLLRNEKGLLPLSRNQTIAVIGPNADNPRNQLGDYTSFKVLQRVTTVLEGIKSRAGGEAEVVYAKGCEILGDDRSGFAQAVDVTRRADVAIVVVGEKLTDSAEGDMTATNGERSNVASLDLTGVQEDLIKAVYETGTPTVVVLISGRPLSIRWVAEHIPAIVETWFPGERGGEAVAGVLFGDYNPSGRLSITFPRHSGQLPVYYNYMPSKAHFVSESDYVDMPVSPLYEFGHGLSYTEFEYGGLRLEPREIGPAGCVSVSVDVKNTGDREGEEVVQLYLCDLLASVTTPVQRLRGFQKVRMEPGETKTVQFTLATEDLALLNQHMEWVVEPGTFEVMVGHSCQDIRQRATFEVKS